MNRGFSREAGKCAQFCCGLGVSEAGSADLHAGTTTPARARECWRGLHYQRLQPEPQGKLVRCVAAKFLNVGRRHPAAASATFRASGLVERPERRKPPFCCGYHPDFAAWFFLTLSPSADVLYKASGLWSAKLVTLPALERPSIADRLATGRTEARWNRLLAQQDRPAAAVVDAEVFA